MKLRNQTFRTALALAVIGAITTTAVGLVHWSTRDRIEAAEHQQLIDRLEQIIPATLYNNNLTTDKLLVRDPLLGSDQLQTIWRARRDNTPVAAVLSAIAPDGYGGPITLLIGILINGEISTARVLGHRETPGLGDDIEITRSEWITGFDGKSLRSLSERQWQVKRDGGVFDQLTGATITPRAIVAAIHSALRYFEQNQEIIFAQ